MSGKGRELHLFLNSPRPDYLMPTPFSLYCKEVFPLSNVTPPLQLNSSVPALALGEGWKKG